MTWRENSPGCKAACTPNWSRQQVWSKYTLFRTLTRSWRVSSPRSLSCSAISVLDTYAADARSPPSSTVSNNWPRVVLYLKHTIKTKICFKCPLQHSWLNPANVVTKTETLNAALETWKNARGPNNSTWLWLGIPITRTVTKLNNVTSIVSQNEVLQSQHQHFQQFMNLIGDMCHLQLHWELLGNIHGFFNPAQSQPKATTEGPITKKPQKRGKWKKYSPMNHKDW